jgi:L-lactate dehydrogenase complex protein LldG
MSSRERILVAIRRNRPAAEAPLPAPIPFSTAPVTPALIERFRSALAIYGGKTLELAPGHSVQALIDELFPERPSLCSATAEVVGTHPLPPVDQPQALATVEIGVARAAFGVAETGSVFLSEVELRVNALGYLVQHFVILLDPAALLETLQEAYARPEFLASGYAVLMTGPSATADIEGVLIRGAQGVRGLTVIICPPTGI